MKRLLLLLGVVVCVLTGGKLSAYAAAAPDTDGDGMPDSWEIAHGLNPTNSADAFLDTDGDGMINVDEYRADTDPLNSGSLLQVTSIALVGGQASLCFASRPGLLYTVQYQGSLQDANWTGLANFVGTSSTTCVADFAAPA